MALLGNIVIGTSTFMSKIKSEKTQITIKIPNAILEEIDQVCQSTYISRTSWFISAARTTLKNKRNRKIEDVLEKISDME